MLTLSICPAAWATSAPFAGAADLAFPNGAPLRLISIDEISHRANGPSGVIGKVISHDRMEERLGGGGMGEVFRGEDTKLGRGVAFKFLPSVWAEGSQPGGSPHNAQTLTGDTASARKSYQEFLAEWKDADPEIPVYRQAQAEYAKIK